MDHFTTSKHIASSCFFPLDYSITMNGSLISHIGSITDSVSRPMNYSARCARKSMLFYFWKLRQLHVLHINSQAHIYTWLKFTSPMLYALQDIVYAELR